MKKADLHCHSTYSEHPTEWFLQKLGAKESYTDPLHIYQEAKRMGMDYVTITDHNKIDGALILKEMYPDDVIVGVESTAYFPEDRCKIHILIYGLNEIQFEMINHLRTDIYELRDYLQKEGLTHSVAHASYSVNGKLKTEHLEKLILLFDHFEIVNGGRNKSSNQSWQHILENLNEPLLKELYNKHKIQPCSSNPWKKAYTGGSDDHGGLFLAKTYTQARANNCAEFLAAIRDKKSVGIGRHNSFHALAFTVYKIAWDFSKQKDTKQKSPSLFTILSENIFENRNPDLKQRFKMKTLSSYADWQGDKLQLSFKDLVEMLKENRSLPLEDKLDRVYMQISKIADAYFGIMLNTLETDLKDLNLVKIIKNISSSLPGIFFLLPFFSSLKHMHQTQQLVNDLRESMKLAKPLQKRRTLWFSDTINDLNGVSVTLKQMGKIAAERGREMMIVSSLSDAEITDEIPSNFLNLPYMYVFRLPFYEHQLIKIPSILQSLKMINDFEPDQIIISTPGPIGLLALLAARLLHIPCTGIYHTDFFSEAKHIVYDESGSGLVLEYEKWFYNQMDEIRTPTREYAKILAERDISAPKMGLLRRGIEIDHFAPYADRKSYLRSKSSYKEGITLMYAGRISKDKSLALLADVYIATLKDHPDLNLIICGNGPYLSELKEILKTYPRVIFTGAVSRDILPKLYNAADFFVFPSVTDTYGMVILESLACGLPALVSNHGGPKEILEDGSSGFVVPDQKVHTWHRYLSDAVNMIHQDPDSYSAMRKKARQRVINSADWDAILDDILGEDSID